MSGHEGCAEALRNKLAGVARNRNGDPLEVTVSTAPPLIRGPYTADPFRCTHGVLFYLEPTTEQRLRWAEEGVA